MRYRSMLFVLVGLLTAACTAGPPVGPETPGAAATGEIPVTASADPGEVSGPSTVPEFDLASVPLMEIDADVPVPVPAGGELDTDRGFTGAGVTILYPSVDAFETFAAFYDAWFASQGIDAFRVSQSSSARAETWDATVDGTPVRIFMYEPSTGPTLTLEVTWS